MLYLSGICDTPSIKATPIFKQIKRRTTGEALWQKFKTFELKQVMTEDTLFVEIISKIGNILTEEEMHVIESRFITKEAQSVCPEGIRLIFTNAPVNEYNHSILNCEENKIISLASDVFVAVMLSKKILLDRSCIK